MGRKVKKTIHLKYCLFFTSFLPFCLLPSCPLFFLPSFLHFFFLGRMVQNMESRAQKAELRTREIHSQEGGLSPIQDLATWPSWFSDLLSKSNYYFSYFQRGVSLNVNLCLPYHSVLDSCRLDNWSLVHSSLDLRNWMWEPSWAPGFDLNEDSNPWVQTYAITWCDFWKCFWQEWLHFVLRNMWNLWPEI